MTLPDRSLPKHLTATNWDAYQVRIVRDGVEHSSSFTWAQYGSKDGALAAAIEWRDAMLLALPPELPVRLKPLAHKQSWGRVGITRYQRVDRRKPGNPRYVTFGVNWVDENGKRKTKSFQAGRVEDITYADEVYAANTAEAFRLDYEWSRVLGYIFQPEKYDNWRKQPCFPFALGTPGDNLSAGS